MYTIAVRTKAARQLKKLAKKHPNDIAAIEAGITSLENWPDVKNVKQLTSQPYQYRLRVGKFRILFDVETTVKVVSVEEAKRRDENTY